MTELERALLHIKTRADAWALKEVEKAIDLDYKTAFRIACALLNGDTLYGMDAESIFSEIMKKDGCVCSLDYENYILTHLNELRDDKALSQEPTDTWSIKDVADTFKKHGLIREQEPCDDAISREAVLDGIEELKKSPWATDKRGNGFEYLITEALDVVKDLCRKELPSVSTTKNIVNHGTMNITL